MSVASIINFKHISYFILIIDEFEQINAEWAWETIVSDNKFVFRNWEIYCPMGLEDLLGYIFYHYSPNISSRKDKFSRQCFKKISINKVYISISI